MHTEGSQEESFGSIQPRNTNFLRRGCWTSLRKTGRVPQFLLRLTIWSAPHVSQVGANLQPSALGSWTSTLAHTADKTFPEDSKGSPQMTGTLRAFSFSFPSP